MSIYEATMKARILGVAIWTRMVPSSISQICFPSWVQSRDGREMRLTIRVRFRRTRNYKTRAGPHNFRSGRANVVENPFQSNWTFGGNEAIKALSSALSDTDPY